MNVNALLCCSYPFYHWITYVLSLSKFNKENNLVQQEQLISMLLKSKYFDYISYTDVPPRMNPTASWKLPPSPIQEPNNNAPAKLPVRKQVGFI